MSRPIVRPPQSATYSVELAVESESLGVIVVAEIQGFDTFDKAHDFALQTTGLPLLKVYMQARDAGMNHLIHDRFARDAGVSPLAAVVVAQNVTEYLPGTVTTVEVEAEPSLPDYATAILAVEQTWGYRFTTSDGIPLEWTTDMASREWGYCEIDDDKTDTEKKEA